MLLLAVTLMVVAAAFDDCSLKNDNHFPYNTSFTGGKYVPVQVNSSYAKIPLIAILPTGQQRQKFPVLAFMHGNTGTLEMYLPNLRNYASHGFIVIFPYIKSPKKDKSPLTTNTNGEFLLHAIKFAKQANGNSTSLLYGQVDLGNIIVAGHSMGATCAIMAGKRLSNPENKVIDPASIKGIVTQHPGICGPFGPPPWPNTWLMSDLATLNAKFPVLFTTATNDAAFWPSPLTAKHELGCFNGALESRNATDAPAAFVDFSTNACQNDGARPPFDDGGHNCPFKNGVETPWVLTFAKLYGQQGGRKTSKCWKMVYGGGLKNGFGVNFTRILL